MKEKEPRLYIVKPETPLAKDIHDKLEKALGIVTGVGLMAGWATMLYGASRLDEELIVNGVKILGISSVPLFGTALASRLGLFKQ